uniref:ABC transporter permease n=1 Tax=Roseihalotalea indica TaxID=2867963 RepID=A0AA49JEI0_9BACT|nr:ABC transporter permease [Tunicatimonas sp. TK19036]
MNFLKAGIRTQVKHKWFSLINLLGLSLGIGCSIMMLLYVNAHLSTDAHHTDAEHIYRVVLQIATPDGHTEYEPGSSLPMATALAEDYSQIEQAAFCMKFYRTPTITVEAKERTDRYKEENITAYADQNFIGMFDHPFLAGDKRTALLEPKSAVLSEAQALKYFGTTDVIGRNININHNTDLMVTGVFATPKQSSDFQFDVLVSLPTLKTLSPNYQDQNFTWIGSNNWTFIKLKEGAQETTMQQQLTDFAKKHLRADLSHWSFHLQPLTDMHFDTRYDGVINKTILWVLMGVALALILVVSINYTNLSIAQSHYRAKEIGVRKYLGGSKAQLFVQFMSETGLLIFLAVVLALLGIYAMLPIINEWLQVDLQLMQLAAPDKLLYFLLFITALLLLAGYYPAVRLSGFAPLRAIQGKSLSTDRKQLFRKALITFQYTVALFFLVGTLVIIAQVKYLVNGDLGFTKDAIITIKVPKQDFTQLSSFRNELLKLSGVAAASLQNQSPMAPTLDGGFIEYDHRGQYEDFLVRDRWADDQFLETYSLSLVAGRNIILKDLVSEVIVNESLLRKLNISDPEEALGKTILFDNSSVSGPIVGVVKDFHHRSLQNEIEPVAIYPFHSILNQVGVRFSSAVNEHTLEDIASVWQAHFPDDVFQYSFLDEAIARMYHTEQTTRKLMSIFAVISVVICLMGILGLSTITTYQRTKELGIRKVLGASVSSILMLLGRQYLVLFGIAFAIALPLAQMVINEWLSGFAYHIELSWAMLTLPGLLMITITLLLIGGQSLKTALANPTDSLKHE